MKKEFFAQFTAQEKSVHKSLAFTESEWRLFEAYKLYGSHQSGHDIPSQKLLRQILLDHIQRDRTFLKEQDHWLDKLNTLENAAGGSLR